MTAAAVAGTVLKSLGLTVLNHVDFNLQGLADELFGVLKQIDPELDHHKEALQAVEQKTVQGYQVAKTLNLIHEGDAFTKAAALIAAVYERAEKLAASSDEVSAAEAANDVTQLLQDAQGAIADAHRQSILGKLGGVFRKHTTAQAT